MKTFLSFATLAAIITACTNENPEYNEYTLSCRKENPIQELPWLKLKVDTLDTYKSGYRAIKLVEFRGDGYFVIEDIWSSSPGGSIYNCQGARALPLLNVSYNDFIDSAKEIKLLYKKD